MRPEQFRPALYVVQGAEMSLTEAALLDLMQAALSKGASFRFRAKGWSMTPFIRDGDTIAISPLRQGEPRLGDVVVYRQPATGKLAVHRVVARRGDDCLIQGDAISQPDGWALISSVLGRVTRIEREGRRVQLGMGPERLAIALLDRHRLWLRGVYVLCRLIWPRHGGRRVGGGLGDARGGSMSNLRIVFARAIIRASNLLRSLPVLVMRPDDLIEFSRRTYARPATVESWSDVSLVGNGLYENEQALLQQCPAEEGKLLLLGLGGGREAIPLARHGFQVTGVDFVPGMVEHAVANAAQASIRIEGRVQEISQLDVPSGTFDVVWFSSRLYSCIPTRRRRVAMLARIGRVLCAGGYLVCQFDWRPGQKLSPRGLLLRRVLASLTFGHTGFEPGDQLLHDIEFVHSFSDEKALRSEWAEGGFEVLFLDTPPPGYGGAVLRKTPTGPTPGARGA